MKVEDEEEWNCSYNNPLCTRLVPQFQAPYLSLSSILTGKKICREYETEEEEEKENKSLEI